MAGIKHTFSKGLTTINVKASNFMEENKFKTHIATLEAEAEKLKVAIGEKLYQGYVNGNMSLESVSEELEALKEKYDTIEKINGEIENLSAREMEILGNAGSQNGGQPQNVPMGEVQFCSMCGTPNKVGYKFCEKCGNKLG